MFESMRAGLLGGGNDGGGFFGLGGRDDSPAEQFASWLPTPPISAAMTSSSTATVSASCSR
jgi:hypothetical protein